MSFAKDTKLQIIANPLPNTESELAFMGALLHTSGEFDLAQKSVSFLTDIPALYDFTNDIITRLYGKGVGLEISDDKRLIFRAYNARGYEVIEIGKRRSIQLSIDLEQAYREQTEATNKENNTVEKEKGAALGADAI